MLILYFRNYIIYFCNYVTIIIYIFFQLYYIIYFYNYTFIFNGIMSNTAVNSKVC